MKGASHDPPLLKGAVTEAELQSLARVLIEQKLIQGLTSESIRAEVARIDADILGADMDIADDRARLEQLLVQMKLHGAAMPFEDFRKQKPN